MGPPKQDHVLYCMMLLTPDQQTRAEQEQGPTPMFAMHDL